MTFCHLYAFGQSKRLSRKDHVMTSILKFGLTEDLGERERGRFFDLTF